MVPLGVRPPLVLSIIFTTASLTSGREVLLHTQSRPIVTGCLDACGYKDTQCVTECQVCVEHHSCGAVTNCEVCEKQVLATRRASLKADFRTTDSGGQSLIHEGLRVQYLTAQINLEDEQHKLFLARDEVITAQTTYDYSSKERSDKAHDLRAARKHKVGAQESVHRWSKKNAERLERAERRLQEAREEAVEEQKKLKEEKAELRKAHRRVKQIKQKVEDEEEDQDALKKAKEEEWDAQRRVEEEKQKVEERQDAVTKRKKEAKWVDKHLKQRVEGKQDEVEVAADNLQDAENREKQAFKVLKEKREAYKLQIKRSEAAEDKVARLEKELEEHPLPGKHRALETTHAAVHSVAFSVTVGALPLLSLWLAF